MELNRLESMDKLDVEYLKVLSIIKPYITCIMDNAYIEMIKLWLEKLGNDGRVDKLIRNQYLIYLGKQIQRGILQKPFNQPPGEKLEPLGHPTETTSEVDFEDLQVVLNMKKGLCGKRRRLKRSNLTRKSGDGYSDSSWQDLSDESGGNYAAGDSTKTPAVYKKHQDQSDFNKMLMVIEKLRKENAALNEVIQRRKFKSRNNPEVQKIASEIEVLKDRLHEVLNIKTALQSSHSSVTSEWQNAVSSLHKKLSVMQQKNIDLKNIIHSLELKLNESLQRNSKTPGKYVILDEIHKNEIKLLKQKHKEELNKKEIAFSVELKEKSVEFNKKIDDLQSWYEKELNENRANLKQEHATEIEGVERKIREECESRHFEKIKEFEEKQIKFDKFYEKQLEEIKSEHAKEINLKNTEINRLELLLQEQCKRMQEEVQTIRKQLQAGLPQNSECNDENVVYLQKCVVILDRMYRKAEKHFAKQLLRLRKEMDLREKHYQILLGTHRVNLISANNAAKQNEIDEIVGRLEQHYIGILTEQQKEAFEQSKNDRNTITNLQMELEYLKTNL